MGKIQMIYKLFLKNAVSFSSNFQWNKLGLSGSTVFLPKQFFFSGVKSSKDFFSLFLKESGPTYFLQR